MVVISLSARQHALLFRFLLTVGADHSARLAKRRSKWPKSMSVFGRWRVCIGDDSWRMKKPARSGLGIRVGGQCWYLAYKVYQDSHTSVLCARASHGIRAGSQRGDLSNRVPFGTLPRVSSLSACASVCVFTYRFENSKALAKTRSRFRLIWPDIRTTGSKKNPRLSAVFLSVYVR